MGTSIFGIGLSGLNAAQLGLATTSHNIANVNTAGYTRQAIVQVSAQPQFSGAGYIGSGTQVTTIRRLYSQFLANQMLDAKTQTAHLDTYRAQLGQIDNMLADPASGLSPALQQFFQGVHEVANSPAAATSRQSMLSAAQALVARFQMLDQRLTDMRNAVNGQITAGVQAINSYAREIALLNERIALAEGNGMGQPPNDLMDQRDALVAELSREVGATVVRTANGEFNVFIGNGQALVIGSRAFALQALTDPRDASRMTVGLVTPGNVAILPENGLEGGALGGLLAFRNLSLEPTRNMLGRVAIGIAGTFNDQHRLGQDLNGTLGGNFFVVPAPRITASANNTGSAQIAATFASYSALTTSDYRLTYDGANYTLTRVVDGSKQIFATLPQTVDGVTISLASGAPAAGDEFLIRPTANGASGIAPAITDPVRIAAAAPIRTARALTNTGGAVISAGTVNAPPPPNANLQQPVTITFTSATTFNVAGTGTGNPVGVAFVSGGNISYNGWTIQITGTPAAGDTFTIGPNTGGVADNRNALLLAALQTQQTLANGTASYQSAYSQLVSAVGNTARDVENTLTAQEALLTQAQQAEQSFSGVNLDEEAANLVRYQQAYQAAGKVLQIADKLFSTLLELGN